MSLGEGMYSRGMKSLFEKVIISERFAIKILSSHLKLPLKKFYHVTEIDNQSPVDFICLGQTYDVKFSNLCIVSHRKIVPIWDFDLRGKTDYCDWFVLIGMEDDNPISIYLVPAHVAPTRHLRISAAGKSKWTEYKIWGLDVPINPIVSPKIVRKAKQIKRKLTKTQWQLMIKNMLGAGEDIESLTDGDVRKYANMDE